jgi:hypothetical protein
MSPDQNKSNLSLDDIVQQLKDDVKILESGEGSEEKMMRGMWNLIYDYLRFESEDYQEFYKEQMIIYKGEVDTYDELMRLKDYSTDQDFKRAVRSERRLEEFLSIFSFTSFEKNLKKKINLFKEFSDSHKRSALVYQKICDTIEGADALKKGEPTLGYSEIMKNIEDESLKIIRIFERLASMNDNLTNMYSNLYHLYYPERVLEEKK